MGKSVGRACFLIASVVVVLARGAAAVTAAEPSDHAATMTARAVADTPRFRIPTAPPEEPLPAAQRHVRKAREYLRASCEMATCGNRFAIDGYYTACQEAWDAVWTCPCDPDILHESAELYADALAGLLETARQHGRLTCEGLWIGPPGRVSLVPLVPKALHLGAARIDSIEPQAQRDDTRIARRHLRAGFGLPVVVRLETGGDAPPAPRSTRLVSPVAFLTGAAGAAVGTADPAAALAEFAPFRMSLAATAVLRFDRPGGESVIDRFVGTASRNHAAAVLDLANPVEIAAVQIGAARPPLAADLTAPLLDMLAGMPREGIEGFLQPYGDADTIPRVEFLEPHRPGRVPVVFIHGLASDEGTWFDLINELRAWPAFHRCFEPWVYHYPTGTAFMQASATLRRELTLAVRMLDPEGCDPALRQMVLVGHSMGGLHAKMQVVASGDALWNAVACQPLETMRLLPEARERLESGWFFEPRPFVSRVVCIATPHRGSALASRAVGRLASLTVRPPAEARAIFEQTVRQNPGGFRPEFERRPPTTIDLLEPQSSVLQAMERLRPACWVTVHSIHGDVHHSLAGRDDMVVPVWSARTAGAVSELAVPASHTRIHHHPATVGEIQRILARHLAETGRAAPNAAGGGARPHRPR
jgi:pimeloyl-ACP methyl ester carboxylesterase